MRDFFVLGRNTDQEMLAGDDAIGLLQLNIRLYRDHRCRAVVTLFVNRFELPDIEQQNRIADRVAVQAGYGIDFSAVVEGLDRKSVV